MSWPRQGSHNSLENPKFERKSWISWVWGRACQEKFGGCPPPECSTTTNNPSQWHYVATRLMAHMGTCSPDEMNGLHWLWHQRAGLPIPATMLRHSISAIPGSTSAEGYASGHQRPRFQEVPEPASQTARHNSPRSHGGPPAAVGSPSGTHGSPLRPFAPRWDQGSRHAPGMRNRTPDRYQEARNPDQSRRRSRTQHPPQHGELSSMRVRTEAVEAPTTRRPDRHRLPPIPCTGPRGLAPTGRTSPPFPRRPSERNRQRSILAPTRQQTVNRARLPPPSQSVRPVRCRGDGTPRTRGQRDLQQTSNPNRGWGDEPSKALLARRA